MGGEREWEGVRADSKSSILIYFNYQGVQCKERIRLKPSPANLKRAAQHRGAILDAIAKGTFNYAETFPNSPRRFKFSADKSAGLPVATYLEDWLNAQKDHLKASTWDDYSKIVFNTLIPEFGKIDLPELRRSHVQAWGKRQKAGNKRLANVQSVFRKALHDRLGEDDSFVNPLHGWKYSRNDLKKTPVKEDDDIDVFDAGEQKALLAVCEPQHRNLFQFAFWTGLRTSELCALTWGDIDWHSGYARVDKAKTQVSNEIEGTKTKKGTRMVKLLPPALEALTAQKTYSFLANAEIFLNPRTGKPWKGDQPIRQGAWTHALRLAGLRYRNPYQTRHTYASMMLTAGEDLAWLAGQMGHSDLQMISRVYGQFIKSAVPDAGNKAVVMFAGATKGKARTAKKSG